MGIFTSLLTAGTNSHPETSENFNALATDFITSGVAGAITLSNGVTAGTGSFAVNAQGSPNMTLAVSPGTAWFFATPSSQGSQAFRVKNTTLTNVTIASNASGSTKYDWVYISIDATKAANPAVDASDVATLVTSRSSSNSVDNGTPPTYGYCLGYVTVANGAASITQGNIVDKRANAILSSAGISQTTSWNSLGIAPNTVAANGNRSYTLTFNGVDLTGTLSPGMRLRTTRTVAAPTQCTSLNGSTQYFSKSSPSAMAQTDSITEYVYCKLISYAQGGLISRNNGTTDGWKFYVNSSGQVVLAGARAADDAVTSAQSLPLNKWVHVSASINTTTTTGVITIDGQTVPVNYTNNANTGFLTPTQSYLIGATNGASPTDFFAGKIAQAASFNAVITPATILTYLSQGLAGPETSLISAYSFNNSINDLNTGNANNLTANGSALATTIDAPFSQQAGGVPNGSLDYGIVQSSGFSTNTTVMVQVPEGNTIPTSGGVSAVVYSSNKAPYGFPVQKGKWTVQSQHRAQASQGSAAASTWYNVGNQQLNMPVGEWYGGFDASPIATATGNAIFYQTLATTSNGAGIGELTTQSYLGSSSTWGSPRARRTSLSVSVATPYYLNMLQTGGTSVTLYNMDGAAATVTSIIEFENAYI